jgi:hypothetical protein
VQVDQRIPAVERAEQAGQVEGADADHGADAQAAPQPGAGLLHDGLRAIQLREGGLRLGEERRAGRGERNGAGRPVEQGRAQVRLQRLDTGRHGRLHRLQPLRGAGEAQLLGDRDEVLQLTRLHLVIIASGR